MAKNPYHLEASARLCIIIAGLLQTPILLAGEQSATEKATPPIVGYGCSNAVFTVKDQELFYMGFEAALDSRLKRKLPPGSVLFDKVSDGSPMGARRSAERLMKAGVAMLVGFPTSHEALLAADITKGYNRLAIFSGSHSDLAKQGPRVFTTGESMTTSVKALMVLIRERAPHQLGLMISDPKSVASMNQYEIQKNFVKEKSYPEIKIDSTLLDRDHILSSEVIEKLKIGRYQYIYLSAFPDDAIHVMKQFKDNSIDIPIYTNGAWTTKDVELLRRFITERTAPTYSVTLWVQGSKEAREFEQKVRKLYGREPVGELAYGYDLGAIVSEVLNRIPGKITDESVLSAFHSNLCFKGLTDGEACFPKTGGHAIRKPTPVRFTRKGAKWTWVPLRSSSREAFNGKPKEQL